MPASLLSTTNGITMKKMMLVAMALLPMAAVADGYSGFYLGATVGASTVEDKGTGHDQADGATNGWTQKTKPDGASLGVVGGYNWLLNDRVVLGIEGDYDDRLGSNKQVNQKWNGTPDADAFAKTKVISAASLRARLGYLVTPETLIYGTAGYALANTERTWRDTLGGTTDTESHTAWRGGWTAGFGAEYLFAKNLSGRVEYRYSDYGSEKVNANLWNEYYKQELKEQTLKIGVTYHFQ